MILSKMASLFLATTAVMLIRKLDSTGASLCPKSGWHEQKILQKYLQIIEGKNWSKTHRVKVLPLQTKKLPLSEPTSLPVKRRTYFGFFFDNFSHEPDFFVIFIFWVCLSGETFVS